METMYEMLKRLVKEMKEKGQNSIQVSQEPYGNFTVYMR